MCIAVGNVSLEDCDWLTSWLGWTGVFAAQLAAGELDGAVADDLVYVHVRLRAGAGLPHAEREFAVECASDNLIRHASNELSLPPRRRTDFGVDQRGGLLDVRVGATDLDRHPVVADGEVDERALRLRAPVVFGGDVDGPHRVGLGAEAGCARPDSKIKHAGWLRRIVFAHDDLLAHHNRRSGQLAATRTCFCEHGRS